MKTQELARRARGIKILLMDVDGVLTDGKMYFVPGADGGVTEVKSFHALDGIGLRLLRTFGIETGVITGRKSPATEERARTLCMKYVYQGFLSKLAPLEKILAHSGFSPAETAYIGDDWTDIPVLKRVGLACAPANALPDVKKAAHFITKKQGGEGAVREVCDMILKHRGHWKETMRMVDAARWDHPPKEKLIIVSAA